jgi:hypothetical protein
LPFPTLTRADDGGQQRVHKIERGGSDAAKVGIIPAEEEHRRADR